MQFQEPIAQSESAQDATTCIQQHEHSTTQWTFLLGLGLTLLIGWIAMLLALLPVISTIGSMTVALLLGLAWQYVWRVPKSYARGVKFSAQKLLRYGIILVGVRLNFALIVSSGLNVLILDLILVAFGLLVFPQLASKLGLSKRLAFLLAVGQSICGVSAIGAMAALFHDEDEDAVSLAIALCRIIGTIGVLLFIFGTHFLPSGFYGLLVGSTLHEIAQVVAAGPAGGASAADFALVVKLTRVMFLIPVMVIFSLAPMLWRKQSDKQMGQIAFSWKQLPIPWFIFGFLAIGALNSLGVFPKGITSLLLQTSDFLMAAAVAAMSLMIDLSVIRQTAMRALGVALLLFVIFVAMSSLLIVLLSHF